jgi:hypothetical protein
MPVILPRLDMATAIGSKQATNNPVFFKDSTGRVEQRDLDPSWTLWNHINTASIICGLEDSESVSGKYQVLRLEEISVWFDGCVDGLGVGIRPFSILGITRP